VDTLLTFCSVHKRNQKGITGEEVELRISAFVILGIQKESRQERQTFRMNRKEKMVKKKITGKVIYRHFLFQCTVPVLQNRIVAL
jgi:hypothetical protein